MRKQLLITTLFTGALAAALPAAQPDDAWLAWVGCWRADGDTTERMLCIVPDGDGVRSIIMNGSRIESESRIIANGQPRTIDQEGCAGTETARWSADRQRVFINADLNCGNGVTRRVSGIFAMLGSNRWASVQSITTAGNTNMHTVRYVEAAPASLPADIAAALGNNRLARETVRYAAASPLDLSDVRDAVAHVDARTVEGWLTTVDQPFDLTGRDLIELADAGVPSSVIDVLVAVSNPQHFAVREERPDDRLGRRRVGSACIDYFYDPYNPFAYRGGYYYGSNYYGYGCRTPWGIYPWGGGYWGGGTVIVIDRPNSPRTRGRVTRDGYKAPTDVTSTPSRTSGSSSGNSSGTSSGSSTSSDSGGGRKAKPRDNNN